MTKEHAEAHEFLYKVKNQIYKPQRTITYSFKVPLIWNQVSTMWISLSSSSVIKCWHAYHKENESHGKVKTRHTVGVIRAKITDKMRVSILQSTFFLWFYFLISSYVIYFILFSGYS